MADPRPEAGHPGPYPILEIKPTFTSRDEWMGSKDKFWFSQSGMRAQEWLFKYPRPQSGEHWAEKIAAEVAGWLHVPHAYAELAVWEADRGVAVQNFVDAGWNLMHGNQVLTDNLRTYRRPSTFRHSQHTLQSIWQALEKGFPTREARERVQSRFAEYLVLDALIGNTDRHDENWGLLAPEAANGWPRSLAPSFDHASSLGRELSDTRRDRILAGDDIGRYVQRGRGGIYGENDVPLSPLALARQAIRINPDLFSAVGAQLKRLDEEALRQIIDRIPQSWMSRSARSFSWTLMRYSLGRLREALA